MRNIFDVAIIGGGASGLMSAIIARRRGKKVILLEKNEKLGRKILLTGNGRCNISNENVGNLKTIYTKYNGHNPKFAISVFSKFNLAKTKQFFRDIGIEFKEEDNGRLFPVSNEAQSVVEALVYEIKNLSIKVKTKTNVIDTTFDKTKKLFLIKTKQGETIYSQKIVISTGGKTYPVLGTVGDGYKLAQNFGHRIYKQFPSYSGLITKSQICQDLQGVKLITKVKAFLPNTNKPFAQNIGTLMFAHFGLSAPVVLEISRQIAQKLYVEKYPFINLEINLLPDYQINELEKLLIKRWSKQPQKTLASSFIGLLPKKVAPAFFKYHKIDSTTIVSNINKKLRKKIISILTETTFKITDVKGFEIAHFTAGGIDTKEINPNTCESKLQKGLYFTGEVLDIDGICGGYNLQFAWSTGAIAGMSV